MSCGLMTLTFSGTNELQKMVAEHQVVIAQEDKQFTAEKADYTGTNGVLELTGNPGWRAGLREGKGDWCASILAREEMLVQRKRFHEIAGRRAGPVRLQRAGQAQDEANRRQPRMSSPRSIPRSISSRRNRPCFGATCASSIRR